MTDATATRGNQASPNVPSDEARSRFRGMAAVLAVNLTGWTAVALLFRSEVPAALLQPWLLSFAALWLARLGGLLLTWRTVPAALGSARWLSWWVGAMLVSAALWGTGAWLFSPHLDSTQLELLLVIGYTLCIAAAPVLLNHPRAFALFPVLYFGPVIVRIAISERGDSHVQAVILLFVFALTFMVVRGFRQSLLSKSELQRQSDRLLEQLRIEKASAEAARLAAEAANRAKSRFLAAASHDLRQPMHAMGLFAGALRHKKLDADTALMTGMANRIGTLADAQAWAAEIAGFAPLSLRHSKRVLNDDGAYQDRSDLHKDLFDKAWGSQDVIEAQVARIEKRAARFQGA